MQTRKLVYVSLFLVVLGLSSSTYAGFRDLLNILRTGVPIDKYGRTLQDHEERNRNKLGHTLKKHVNKDLRWLRKRCKIDMRRKGVASTYRSTMGASTLIRDAILEHKDEIDRFATRSAKITDDWKGTIKKDPNDSNNIRKVLSGYGEGINCLLVDKIRIVRVGPLRLPLPLDYMPYFAHNVIVAKKNRREKGKWFLLTSYPKLFNSSAIIPYYD